MSPMFHWACCCPPNTDLWNLGLFLYRTPETYHPLRGVHFVEGDAFDNIPDATYSATYPLFGTPVRAADGGYAMIMESGSYSYLLSMPTSSFTTTGYVWERGTGTSDASLRPVRDSLAFSPNGTVGFRTWQSRVRVINPSNWSYSVLWAPPEYINATTRDMHVFFTNSSGNTGWSIVINYQWCEGSSPNYIYYKQTVLLTGNGTSTTSQTTLINKTVIPYAQFGDNYDAFYSYCRSNGENWVYSRIDNYALADTNSLSVYNRSGGDIVSRAITDMGIPSGSNNLPVWMRFREDKDGALWIYYSRLSYMGQYYDTYTWSARKFDDATATFGEDILADRALTYNLGKGTSADPDYWPNGEHQGMTDLYLGFDPENDPVVTYSLRAKDGYNAWSMALKQLKFPFTTATTVIGSTSTYGPDGEPFYWLP